MNNSEKTFTVSDLKNWSTINDQFDVPALLSVFGNPVEHSLSPQLHNPALDFCGIKSQYVKIKVSEKEFPEALEKLNKNDEVVFIIAGLAIYIIELANKGNEIALSVIQQATHAVAQYILSITHTLEYKENNIVLAGNGSIIKNIFFRNSLNDELRFDFPEIKWTFSTLSPAYGAGIMAARLHSMEVKITDILKGNVLVPA